MSRTARLRMRGPMLFAGLILISAFTTGSGPAVADARSDAQAWCNNYRATTGGQCNVEKCPCGFKEKRLKTFSRPFQFGMCVCSARSDQREVNQRRAAEACRNYTASFGKPCRVVQNHCGISMMPVAKFGDGPLVRYSACREKDGPERLKNVANTLVMTAPHAAFLVSQYDKWMTFLASAADRPTPLRSDHIQLLQRHFSNVDLRQVRIAYSARLEPSKPGERFVCTTDCKTIYCGSREFVASIRNGPVTIVTDKHLYFHEMAHTEQCQHMGGRNRYAMMWFRHLAPGAVAAIKDRDNDTSFGWRLHDGMPMEKEADRKANAVCAGTSLGCGR